MLTTHRQSTGIFIKKKITIKIIIIIIIIISWHGLVSVSTNTRMKTLISAFNNCIYKADVAISFNEIHIHTQISVNQNRINDAT
jgi:hypothetical protein